LSASEAEERAQFTLAMRTRGIDDLELLRALERAPRALFMPQRFADISGRDIALPIGCGQTSPAPSVLAVMIAALRLEPLDRVCEIGTGTGYCTALLAQLAKEIVSLERFQALALEASARLKAFGVANVSVLWGDGYDYYKTGERFDKVIVHGLIDPPAQEFLKLIAGEGVLASGFAGPGRGEQRIVRLTVGQKGPVGILEFGRGRALRPLERGLSRGL
jgi:protein-L-isoaspartate(D-aspartate) O-methyltransferase